MRRSSVRVGARCLFAASLIVFSGVIMFSLTSRLPKALAAHSPVRIMFLGDSITGSPGCWRELLWNNLQSTGYTNIDFVGTLNDSTSCGVPFDGDNEGHAGYTATGIASQNLLPGWLSATSPDIVAMHLGTNDAWGGTAVSTILSAYSTLVSQMRANNPNMIILVAQIIPMNPTSGCNGCQQDVVNLNAAIPGWAASLTTAQSPIIVVDQFTGFDDATDTYDGVHPNDSGNQKIAAKWYPPLTTELKNFGMPVPLTPTATATTPTSTPTPGVTPTSTPTPGITPTSTPTSGGSCKVTYTITGQWPGGFGANIAITNTGTTAWSGWTLTFSFANGQTITQLWNGTVSQAGSNVTVTNASYNGSVAAGASVNPNPGFNGTWNGTNSAPTSFKVNGTTCS